MKSQYISVNNVGLQRLLSKNYHEKYMSNRNSVVASTYILITLFFKMLEAFTLQLPRVHVHNLNLWYQSFIACLCWQTYLKAVDFLFSLHRSDIPLHPSFFSRYFLATMSSLGQYVESCLAPLKLCGPEISDQSIRVKCWYLSLNIHIYQSDTFVFWHQTFEKKN